MLHSKRFLLAVPLAGAAAVLALACAHPSLHTFAPPPAVEDISIEVTGCTTDRIGIVVHPWTAWVARGRPVRWTTPAGVDSVAIEAVRADRWPFQWGAGPNDPGGQARQQPPRQRRGAPGGTPIQAGNVPPHAPVGETYSYRILVYCDGRVLDIDPELIIRDRMGP